MERVLDVYLHEKLAGQLRQDKVGQIAFTYKPSYLEEKGVMALSQSLPLRKETFLLRECRGFFSGILPEGEVRKIIARNLGISAKNDFSMLEQIGGECAGAITFLREGQLFLKGDFQYRSLTKNELSQILSELPRRPLMAGEAGIRLSLAGAQDKMAVFIDADDISIPLENSPSTHILKPSNHRFQGMVFNEALCMALASNTKLHVAKVEIRMSEDTEYLLVERFDRSKMDPGGTYLRMHQEDFCQALGIVSENKYQREGGTSLKDCFALLRDISSAPLIDLQRLLDGVIFNFLIGNHDAHGKNFSLLYDMNGYGKLNVRLAPLYDLVCTDFYPDLDKQMAMEIGGKYISSQILPFHFDKFADDAGLAKPLVKKRILELGDSILDNIEKSTKNNQASKEIGNWIRSRVRTIIDKFNAS